MDSFNTHIELDLNEQPENTTNQSAVVNFDSGNFDKPQVTVIATSSVIQLSYQTSRGLLNNNNEIDLQSSLCFGMSCCHVHGLIKEHLCLNEGRMMCSVCQDDCISQEHRIMSRHSRAFKNIFIL